MFLNAFRSCFSSIKRYQYVILSHVHVIWWWPLNLLKGLQGWDSIWLGHVVYTDPLISKLQFTETRALSLQGFTGMNCNQTRAWDSLYVWQSHFNTILSIMVGVLTSKLGFMTNWIILWNNPCEEYQAQWGFKPRLLHGAYVLFQLSYWENLSSTWPTEHLYSTFNSFHQPDTTHCK